MMPIAQAVGVRQLKVLRYGSIAVGETAVGFDATLLSGVYAAWMRLEGGPIRLRLDGIDPTAAIGFPWSDGFADYFGQGEITGLRMIQSDVGAGTMHYHLYGFV